MAEEEVVRLHLANIKSLTSIGIDLGSRGLLEAFESQKNHPDEWWHKKIRDGFELELRFGSQMYITPEYVQPWARNAFDIPAATQMMDARAALGTEKPYDLLIPSEWKSHDKFVPGLNNMRLMKNVEQNAERLLKKSLVAIIPWYKIGYMVIGEGKEVSNTNTASTNQSIPKILRVSHEKCSPSDLWISSSQFKDDSCENRTKLLFDLVSYQWVNDSESSLKTSFRYYKLSQTNIKRDATSTFDNRALGRVFSNADLSDNSLSLASVFSTLQVIGIEKQFLSRTTVLSHFARLMDFSVALNREKEYRVFLNHLRRFDLPQQYKKVLAKKVGLMTSSLKKAGIDIDSNETSITTPSSSIKSRRRRITPLALNISSHQRTEPEAIFLDESSLVNRGFVIQFRKSIVLSAFNERVAARFDYRPMWRVDLTFSWRNLNIQHVGERAAYQWMQYYLDNNEEAIKTISPAPEIELELECLDPLWHLKFASELNLNSNTDNSVENALLYLSNSLVEAANLIQSLFDQSAWKDNSKSCAKLAPPGIAVNEIYMAI